jgi:hypothetical protein
LHSHKITAIHKIIILDIQLLTIHITFIQLCMSASGFTQAYIALLLLVVGACYIPAHPRLFKLVQLTKVGHSVILHVFFRIAVN